MDDETRMMRWFFVALIIFLVVLAGPRCTIQIRTTPTEQEAGE